MLNINNYIEIGYIKRPHGTQGELAAMLTRDFAEDSEFIMLMIDGVLVPFFVEDWRYKSSDILLLSLEDISNEERAKQLVGCKLYIDKSFYTREQEYFIIDDFVGFTLISQTGQTIGIISEIDQSTINTLLMVYSGTDTELIVPYHEDFVINLDQENKTITLHLPNGITTL